MAVKGRVRVFFTFPRLVQKKYELKPRVKARGTQQIKSSRHAINCYESRDVKGTMLREYHMLCF